MTEEWMECPSVSVIPATKRSLQNNSQLKEQKDVRVAAYCRVSTGDESQQTSYTKQREHYTALINSREGWHFAGIYADEAISGTTRSHRAEFNRMIEDAQAGQLDYIITKSISRFARNTIDTLDCVRQLRQKNPPVGIFFEKENIDTLDATGELILTILSALAQDESRSISDNIRWSFQKNFQAGKPQINLKRMLGYDKDEKGNWVINPVQAEMIQYIFHRFLQGGSANRIAKELNQQRKTTVNGKSWRADSVYRILKNEKFVGDLEMQKTVTRSYLTHQSAKNRGEAPKYYVTNHHEGIVDRMTWERVQAMLENRRRIPLEEGEQDREQGNASDQKRRNAARLSPFYNLRCAVETSAGDLCGMPFFRMTYTGNGSYPVWRCKRKHRSGNISQTGEQQEVLCPSVSLQECALEQSFMELLYRLKQEYQQEGENCRMSRQFREVYEAMDQKSKSSHSLELRRELLDLQIRDLEEKQESWYRERLVIGAEREGEEAGAGEDCDDWQRTLEELRQEKEQLEADLNACTVMEKNYQLFLRCLEALPETNAAGSRLRVVGRDLDEIQQQKWNRRVRTERRKEKKKKLAIESTGEQRLEKGKETEGVEIALAAPDYLPFEKRIYQTFIRKGRVRKDEIDYLTSFGVWLTSRGNSRTQSCFLGFRSAQPDGTLKLIREPWEISQLRKIGVQEMIEESVVRDDSCSSCVK